MRLQSMIGAILCAALCVTGLLMLGRGADDAKAGTHATLTSTPAAAPNFVGIKAWLNSGPLNIADLRGKVVLVDFWTYGCYNCINTLPHVTRLYDTYEDHWHPHAGVSFRKIHRQRAGGHQALPHSISGGARQRICDLERVP